MTDNITPEGNQKRSRKWTWARRTIQTLLLLLFLYLILSTVQGVTGRLPYGLFFFLDPLAGISSMLAGRTWIAPMALGFIILALTIATGRTWCGWICPLGTILDWTPSRRNKRSNSPSSRWRQGKYVLLFIVIIGAALGSLTLMVLDPITISFRTFSSVIIPGLDLAIEGIESWLYNYEILRPALDWTDGFLRGWLLNSQPFYLPNIVFLVFFGVILGLNALHSRFWCRYLCPLGGLLALLSKISFIRHRVDNTKCISCRKCYKVCPTGSINPDKEFNADAAECSVCLKCMEECPVKAISFGRQGNTVLQPDATRRRLLYSLGASLIAAVLLRFIPAAVKPTNHIRPPGSSEESLYERCIRCGECMRVCPTGVIQPVAADSNLKLWTPALQTRIGYCDYSCNSCGTVCPTGAISVLTLESKRETVIGIASIDRTRCIPWAEGRDCIVCEEMCPVPEKAIRPGGKGRGQNADGVFRPHVIEDLCIGCGICEYQCPVAGESAIRIYPVAMS